MTFSQPIMFPYKSVTISFGNFAKQDFGCIFADIICDV